MPKILENIRVIDITRFVAGPVCTAHLADLGAEVIHLENVGGGDDRAILPVQQGFHCGAGFLQVNRNKKGLTLDLTCDTGKDVFQKLVESSDILVVNMPEKVTKSLKIDYESVRACRPDIIYAHITSFGPTGPYRDRPGFDAIAQVMSGSTYLSGPPGQPMKNASSWVDMSTGNHAAIGILAALLHRNATGKGQKVELNLLHSALSITNYQLMEQALTKVNRKGVGNRAPSGAPADLFPTKDGAVFIAVLGNAMFKRLATVMNRADLAKDARFQSDVLRAENHVPLGEIVRTWTKTKTTADVLERLASFRIPAGPMLTPDDVLADEHVLSTGTIRPVNIPGLDMPVPYVAPAYTLSETPATIDSGPPMPGEHNAGILAGLGYSSDEIRDLKNRSII